MFQQVTITTTQGATLKPLLESAISNEKKTILVGLARTKKHLAEFEQKFNMSSQEFERRLNAGEIQEDMDFVDWRMEIGMLKLLEEQFQALHNVQFN